VLPSFSSDVKCGRSKLPVSMLEDSKKTQPVAYINRARQQQTELMNNREASSTSMELWEKKMEVVAASVSAQYLIWPFEIRSVVAPPKSDGHILGVFRSFSVLYPWQPELATGLRFSNILHIAVRISILTSSDMLLKRQMGTRTHS